MPVELPQIPEGIDQKTTSTLSALRSAMSQIQDENKNNIKSVPAIATEAEAIAGTNDIKIISPLKLRNGLNASGLAPIYACRAWVNFNGTGTVAIRASGNVSGITDNGTAHYIVNYNIGMDDANCCVLVTGAETGNYDSYSVISQTAENCTVKVVPDYSKTWTDSSMVCVAVFK